jgi:hypothetical protein
MKWLYALGIVLFFTFTLGIVALGVYVEYYQTRLVIELVIGGADPYTATCIVKGC